MNKRKSTVKDNPGVIIQYLRTYHGWSYQSLADKCKPTLSRSTIMRIEKNEGYTQDSLKRVAAALKVKTEELFYPEELAGILILDKKSKDKIMEKIYSMVSLHKNVKNT